MGANPNDPSVRIYQTNARQSFHTESVDVVALMCLKDGKKGGNSLFGECQYIDSAQRLDTALRLTTTNKKPLIILIILPTIHRSISKSVWCPVTCNLFIIILNSTTEQALSIGQIEKIAVTFFG